MPRPGLTLWCGRALAAGGALTFLLNATLTPLMARGAPFEQTAATPVFLWRQGLSIAAAALLLIDSIGLYLVQSDRAGAFGAAGFVMALLGSALLMAWEWVNVFVLRDLALRAPATLHVLENAKGFCLYDLGAIFPVVLFSVGWIALAASTLRAWSSERRGAGVLIAGFFATPILSAVLGIVWGGILGNALLGAGWFTRGRAVEGVKASGGQS